MGEGRIEQKGNAAGGKDETSAIERLREEIELAQKQSKSQSYLGAAIDAVWKKDDESLKSLKELDSAIAGARKQGDARTAATLAAQIDDRVKDHRNELLFQQDLNHYGGGFLKTAGIFMRGRLGMAGTVAAYALDQARPTDSLSTQLRDAALGAGKGGLLKASFDFLGKKELGVAAQGVALGVSSRVLDYGLSADTYINKGTGQTDLAGGLGRTLRASLDEKALLSDVIIFGAAHGLMGGVKRLSGGAVEASPLARTMLTGTTFGMSVGSYEEILRQKEAGEAFDLGKVVKKSLIRGAIDTLAAGPGGLQARAAMRGGSSDGLSSLPPREGARALSGSEGLGLAPREFVVVEGRQALERLSARSENQGWLTVREVVGKRADGVETLGGLKRLFMQHLGEGARLNRLAVAEADFAAFCNPERAPEAARGKHLFPAGRGSVFALPDLATGRIAFGIGRIPIELAKTYRLTDAMELGTKRSDTVERGEGRTERWKQTAAEVLAEGGHTDFAQIIAKHPKFRGLEAIKVVGEGNETVAVELAPSAKYPDGAVLKMSIPEGGWENTWGTRPFDAKLLNKPVEVDLESGGTAYITVQERVEILERYPQEQLDAFFRKVEAEGMELVDPGTDPNKQIGRSLITGDLVLIDYSAIDKPGSMETHQQIIGGAQRVEEQYEAENDRIKRGESEERVEDRYESVLDIDFEARRQAFLEEHPLAEHQRGMLKQIFMGESPKDVAYYRAIELGHFDAKGKVNLKEAQAQLDALLKLARKEGLIEGGKKKRAED